MSLDPNCPYDSFELFYDLWHNYSRPVSNGSRDDYRNYVCRYAAYYEQRTRSDAVEGHLVLFFSGFGFLGGLLTVLTLSQAGFRILNFRLYLLIGYLEMLQMAVLALMDGLAYVRCDASYSCTFLWAHVGITIMNICADATDLLILFLCVERTVACLLPHNFRRLHNVRCYKFAVTSALLLPGVFSMFQAFELSVVFDTESERYLDEPSAFSESEFYPYIKQINTIRFYVTAILVATTTTLSIWGFCKVASRRRKLTRNRKTSNNFDGPTCSSSADYSYSSVSTRQYLTNRLNRTPQRKSSRQRHRQTELCYLQLCLAVPVVINHVLYATGLGSNSQFLIGELALRKIYAHEFTFETASREIERAESFQYLRAATNVSNVMAHALHFYLYLMFSVKVRSGFFALSKSGCRRKNDTAHRRTMSANSNVLENNSHAPSTIFNAH